MRIMNRSRVACTALTALLLLLPALGHAQSQTSASTPIPEAILNDLANALTGGDAEALLANGSDRVEVSLFGTRTYYSRAQALYVLRDFFKKYGPRRFEADDVAEAGQMYFVTGRYWHLRAERPLRIYLRVSLQNESWRLHEVRVARLQP
jgi:hypothetical protein